MGLASILCAIEESSSLKRKDIPSLFNLPLPAFWKKVMVEVASSHGGKCHDGSIHLRPQVGKHGVTTIGHLDHEEMIRGADELESVREEIRRLRNKFVMMD